MIEERTFWATVLQAKVANIKVAPLLAARLGGPVTSSPPSFADSTHSNVGSLDQEPSSRSSSQVPQKEQQLNRHHTPAATPSGSLLNPPPSNDPFNDSITTTTPLKKRSPLGSAGLKKAAAARKKLDPTTVKLLQTVLQFIEPLDELRYTQTAIGMSYRGSCIVDRDGTPHTFGAAPRLRSTKGVRFVDCACGDFFVSLLSDAGELWTAGNLEGDQLFVPDDPDTPHALQSMCTGVSMVVASITRLFCLTNSHTIQPLSNTAVNTSSMHPARLCKFVSIGLNEDLMMVGHDNILYKVTASRRAVSTPRRVMSLANIGVSRIASGHGFHLVIDLNGRLFSYGRNRKGQLGNGEVQDSMRTPHLHRELLKYYITSASAGDNHSLVLTSDGHAFGAGSSRDGELGIGAGSHLSEVTTMTRIPLPGPCIGLEAGPTGSIFAMADGTFLSCGSNECGQLGVPKAKIVATPTRVEMPLLAARGVAQRVLCRPWSPPVAGASIPRRNSVLIRNDGTEVIQPIPFNPADAHEREPFGSKQRPAGGCGCCAVS